MVLHEDPWLTLVPGIEAVLGLRTQRLSFEGLYRAQMKLFKTKRTSTENLKSTLKRHFVDLVGPRLRQNLKRSAMSQGSQLDTHLRNQRLLTDIYQAHSEYTLSVNMILDIFVYFVCPSLYLNMVHNITAD